MENEATLKQFVIEYARVHNQDPVDIGMIAGALVSDYMQSRPECLSFVLELRTNAPTLFQSVKLIKEGVPK